MVLHAFVMHLHDGACQDVGRRKRLYENYVSPVRGIEASECSVL